MGCGSSNIDFYAEKKRVNDAKMALAKMHQEAVRIGGGVAKIGSLKIIYRLCYSSEIDEFNLGNLQYLHCCDCLCKDQSEYCTNDDCSVSIGIYAYNDECIIDRKYRQIIKDVLNISTLGDYTWAGDRCIYVKKGKLNDIWRGVSMTTTSSSS
jgi:hypothetical protein